MAHDLRDSDRRSLSFSLQSRWFVYFLGSYFVLLKPLRMTLEHTSPPRIGWVLFLLCVVLIQFVFECTGIRIRSRERARTKTFFNEPVLKHENLCEITALVYGRLYKRIQLKDNTARSDMYTEAFWEKIVFWCIVELQLLQLESALAGLLLAVDVDVKCHERHVVDTSDLVLRNNVLSDAFTTLKYC